MTHSTTLQTRMTTHGKSLQEGEMYVNQSDMDFLVEEETKGKELRNYAAEVVREGIHPSVHSQGNCSTTSLQIQNNNCRERMSQLLFLFFKPGA